MINVNLGSGTAEEARRWVEYVNGGPETEQGRRRAANGRVEPYGVKYWGVGNESWGSYEIGYFKNGTGYAAKFLEFVRAMRSADPDIHIMAVGGIPALGTWNKEVLLAAGGEIDSLSIHVYYPGFTIPIKGKAYPEREYYGIMAAGRHLDGVLDTFDAQIREFSPPGRDIRIAFDEWNLWWNDSQIVRATEYEFSSALFTADILLRLLRRGDRLAFANLAQLVNVLGLVITDPDGGIFVTGGYHSFNLLKNGVKGDTLARTEVTGPTFKNAEYGIVRPMKDNPLIEAQGFTGSETVDLVVINKHYKSAVSATVEISGIDGVSVCALTEINAPLPHSKNTFADPNVIKVVDKKCPVFDNGKAVYEFPAHSITLISLKSRRAADAGL